MLYLKQSSNHQHKEKGKQTERVQVQSHNYMHRLGKNYIHTHAWNFNQPFKFLDQCMPPLNVYLAQVQREVFDDLSSFMMTNTTTTNLGNKRFSWYFSKHCWTSGNASRKVCAVKFSPVESAQSVYSNKGIWGRVQGSKLEVGRPVNWMVSITVHFECLHLCK